MISATLSHENSSVGKHLGGLAIFLFAMAAGMVFSPASGVAADRSATSEKRITVVANDPTVATEPTSASSADGRGAAGKAHPDPAAREVWPRCRTGDWSVRS
jgi:hypothetical protein